MNKLLKGCIILCSVFCVGICFIVLLGGYAIHREIKSVSSKTSSEQQDLRISDGENGNDLAGVDSILHGDPELEEILDQEKNETEKTGIFKDFRKAYKQYIASKKPEEAVKFYLFDDRSNVFSHKEIVPKVESSFKQIRVPEGSTLKILVHGFISHLNGSFSQKMKNAFLEHTNSPVICVDWSQLAAGDRESMYVKRYTERFLYHGIVDQNIPRVAQYIATFISHLKKNKVVGSLSNVHLIGHSLGAHLSGVVGRIVREQAGYEGGLGRITGLDPAGPYFGSKPLENRLDQEDASFVDIIHTSHLLGDRRSTGHVDFYPNSDDKMQPGCTRSDKTGLQVITQWFKTFIGSCDHHRAIDYYVVSITNKTLFGCNFGDGDSDDKFRKCSEQCESSVIFGEYVSTRTRGEYCLNIELDGAKK